MASRFYTPFQLSENLKKTPEGFLICENVPIARDGDLIYMAQELPHLDAQGMEKIIIKRDFKDIAESEAIASFEGKAVTLNHPPGNDVNPENFKEFSIGTIQNVRVEVKDNVGYLMADFLIHDPLVIKQVEDKQVREVSCGYDADYKEISAGIGKQVNIRGNHVALVSAGRCGPECSIIDSLPKQLIDEENSEMDNKEKDNLFTKFMDRFNKFMDANEPAKPKTEMELMQDSISEIKEQVSTFIDAASKQLGPDVGRKFEKGKEVFGKGKDAEGGEPKSAKEFEKAQEEYFKNNPKEKEKEGDAGIDRQNLSGELVKAEEKGDKEKAKKIRKMILELQAKVKAGTAGDDSNTGDELDPIPAVKEKAAPAPNQEVVSKAEIISPGIEKTGDVKMESIKALCRTADGMPIVETLLDGAALDESNVDFVFNAAAAMVTQGNELRKQIKIGDAAPKAFTPPTIEEMNEAAEVRHKH